MNNHIFFPLAPKLEVPRTQRIRFAIAAFPMLSSLVAHHGCLITMSECIICCHLGGERPSRREPSDFSKPVSHLPVVTMSHHKLGEWGRQLCLPFNAGSCHADLCPGIADVKIPGKQSFARACLVFQDQVSRNEVCGPCP